MKRVAGKSIELIEIQLEKFEKNSFMLNIGVAFPEDTLFPWGSIDPSDLTVSGLRQAVRLYRKRPWFSWSMGKWFAVNSNDDAAVVIDEIVGLYPEIDLWLKSSIVGPHMRQDSSLNVSGSPAPWTSCCALVH